MKRWFYIILGVALIANGIAATFYASFPANVFQALWGIVGLWLIYRAVKQFRESTR